VSKSVFARLLKPYSTHTRERERTRDFACVRLMTQRLRHRNFRSGYYRSHRNQFPIALRHPTVSSPSSEPSRTARQVRITFTIIIICRCELEKKQVFWLAVNVFLFHHLEKQIVSESDSNNCCCYSFGVDSVYIAILLHLEWFLKLYHYHYRYHPWYERAFSLVYWYVA